MTRRPALEARIREERRAALVVDVRARRGRAAFADACTLLEEHGLTLESAVGVESQARLINSVEEALASGVPLIVLGGGDGTLRTVAGCLRHRETALGLLPLGTANNFARSLGIPQDLAGAVRLAVSGRVVGVDLARLDHEVFANVAILGFSPDVVRATPPGLKRRLGRAAYLLCEARYLVSQTLFDVTVTTDMGSSSFRTRQMIIANGSHYGTRRLAPTARVDDGLLDILAVDSTSRWQGIRFWLRYPLGRHLRMRGLRRIRCSWARIETVPRLSTIVGGELGPSTPFEVAVDPGALAVVVSPGFQEFWPGP